MTTIDRVLTIIARHSRANCLPETDLIASGAIDSLDFLKLIMDVEEEFGIELPAELGDVRSAVDVARLVDAHASG